MTIKIEHRAYTIHLTCVGCGNKAGFDAYDDAVDDYSKKMPENWRIVTGAHTYKRGGHRVEVPDFALCPECTGKAAGLLLVKT